MAMSNQNKKKVRDNYCNIGEYSEDNPTRIGAPGVEYGEAALLSSLIKDMQALYPFKSPIQSCVTLIMKSNAAIIPHVDAFDTGNWRRICISWALQPSYENFAPTVFYTADGKEIYRHYYDEKAFVLDTRIMHSVTNNDYTRVIFQTTFDAELNDII
jgi:hypothetical protein